ncbi:glycosyltransferase [Marinobacter sp. EVN1]|uniref:glycosyltransferase n=1 Tax=Marinobacter sp. EVN1 TaxID=1397532 RepID=UPI001D0D451E|nr:glycosyltransferase [Marinobacter sp. EVN1]
MALKNLDSGIMEMESPVRILFVIDQFASPYAGTEGQLLQLLMNLPADQFVPELLVLRSSAYIEEGSMPCKVSTLGSSKLFSIKTWLAMFRFARLQKKEGTALCHVFFNDASVICPPIFYLFGIPTLISRRDMGYWYTRKYLSVLRQTARFVRGVVANSEAVKGVTAQKEGFSEGDISVIYNGYPAPEVALHPLQGEARARYLESLGLPEQGRFVVLVANLREIKRIGDAIKAMGIASRAFPDCHLVLIGAGDQQAYRDLAETEGVAEQVHFLGARPDVKDILRAMDIGLLCSESEGYSNAIVEYMQARLPVVASEVGGNSEAVQHGVTGYLFPKGNTEQMAEYLMTLLGDDESMNAMGEAGCKLASQRHALGAMIESHCALYTDMLTRAGARNRGKGVK